MDGTGQKARNHPPFRKFIVSSFLMFSENNATTRSTRKADFLPKKGQTRRCSLTRSIKYGMTLNTVCKQNNHNGYAAFCLSSPASNGYHVELRELIVTPISSANRCQNSAIYGIGVLYYWRKVKYLC